ncbi:hypothetical protein [Serinibacter salmoneus]|uniref:Uncharacterized protein n=1 Tax=Serinibacter salmoneus TaxID=556530 RepID=A0A2A9D4A9_9MICO|nr:hypothetical protein [Serinibacter salmoneus]PFG20690.1 hypothetical protein ATL40_2300 [Serinibacter salmoneus]
MSVTAYVPGSIAPQPVPARTAPTRIGNSRPRLRLLPALAPESEPEASPIDTNLDPAELRLELDAEKSRLERFARHAGLLVGIRGVWGATRWRACEERLDCVVPTFDIQVAGAAPTASVAGRIGARLARAGWTGGVRSTSPLFRMDARREGHRLRLLAQHDVITFSVAGPPLAVGAGRVREVLDGVHEEDE